MIIIAVCSGGEQCIMCYYYNEIKMPRVEWIFEIRLISGKLSRSDRIQLKLLNDSTFQLEGVNFLSNSLINTKYVATRTHYQKQAGSLICIFQFSILFARIVCEAPETAI